MHSTEDSLVRPITAGFVSALVGFTSAFVVVLGGLRSVGADDGQAASGLLAVTVLMGLSSITLSLWSRLPITVAWSTPGAALLASTGVVDGGWAAAVGAFVVTGLLIVVTGYVTALGDLIARIPPSVAQAMLAGVVFQLCLGPVTGLADNPLEVAPVVVTWLVLMRLSPRWATPVAFVVATAVIVVDLARTGTTLSADQFAPHVEWTTPTLTLGGLVGIALPLYLVTMASQNVPGVAVMKSFGFDVPWRRSMLVTGAGTVIGAPAGGHAINLAAISAALVAGPDAGPDRSRRWIASVTSGCVVIVLGCGATFFGTLVLLAPAGVIPTVAGLALLGTFAASLKAALDEPAGQIPAVVTFLTAASGISIASVGAAFWAIVAGLTVHALVRRT